jgi:hypothetical protein
VSWWVTPPAREHGYYKKVFDPLRHAALPRNPGRRASIAGATLTSVSCPRSCSRRWIG